MDIVDVAIGVLVRHRGGQPTVLITRRPHGAVYAGYWELPGGKVETGETPAQCLVREFREEVALHIRVGQSLPVIEHHYPHAHVRLHPFYCQWIEGEAQNLHVAEHRWVRPAELADYHFPEANAAITERVMADLGQRGG